MTKKEKEYKLYIDKGITPVEGLSFSVDSYGDERAIAVNPYIEDTTESNNLNIDKNIDKQSKSKIKINFKTK